MGIFNRSIPTIQPNRQNRLQVVPQQTPYVDDIFDPILNAEVRKYLLDKYGDPISATLGGYAEGVDNALLGQNDKWGILGPGMGILSGFGRSMDKAGDVIIGSLTEGVKGLTGQGIESPLHNIFVEDEDYSGGRLLAAMGNSMAGLAKAPKLTEQDFTGLWNIPSMGLELMTDPGIIGGMMSKGAKAVNLTEQLAEQSANSNLANIGKLLQDYDDFMAKVSIDMTAPGLRQGAKALMNKIQQALGTSSNVAYANKTFNKNATPEERFASQDALRKTSNNMQYHNMYNEVSNITSNLPEEPALSSVNSAQLVLGMGTTVPTAVKEEFDKRAVNVADRPMTGYDQEIYRWLVDENQLTESQALLVMKAMDANLDELIAAENLERTSNLELEDAIRLATDRDLYTKSAKARAFFEDPWVIENIKNTNPNLYADLPDSFSIQDLDTLGIDDQGMSAFLSYLKRKGTLGSATADFDKYRPFYVYFKNGIEEARADVFNKIHEFAKRQHGYTELGKRSQEKVFYIDERELENVLPRVLAEKSPEEAPELYSEYLHKLNWAYDMENESARNSVLRGIGIDPKSRTVRNIQKTPVTLSPSEFTGRSDTAVKLQVQYSHKRLTDFVKKYDINSFEDSPEFIRVFPNPKVRSEIKAKLEELLNFEAFTKTESNGNVSSNTIEYFKKVKEFSDYVIDKFKPVENVDYTSLLNTFRKPTSTFDTLDMSKLLDAFDEEEMFRTIAAKALPTYTLDEVDSLIEKMAALSRQHIPYDKAKEIVKAKDTLAYPALKKKGYIPFLTPLRELGLTSSDFDDYDTILNTLHKAKNDAIVQFYEGFPTTSNVSEDLLDLAEGLQRNVVQPHEFRSGAIREHTPLPNKFWEAQDSYSDETAERWAENEVTAGAKTTTSKDKRGNRSSRPDKYLTTSANTDDTFNFHSTLNNLIRVNPEAFATPEGRKVLQKYFGDSFQVKIHGDYGILDGVSKDAIKAYKDEVLPLIENILERGYSPYVEITKSVSDDLLKNPKYKGSDGYKLRALMGKVPGVKASPHVSAFKLIMDETVVHSDDLPYKLANDSEYVTPADVMLFKQSGGLNVKNSMSPYMYDYLLYNLQSKGVKDPENLLTSFFKGDSLTISDWRILNAAFQDIDVGTVTKDPRLSHIFKNAEDLARSKELHIQNFKDAVPYAYKKANEYVLNSGKYISNSPKYLDAVERKAIGDIVTEFFGRNASLNEYYYKEIQSKIDYFKKIPFENVNLDDVVRYFIQHPDEYVPNGYSSSVVSQLAQYHPNYLQYRRRFYKNKAPLKQLGWIDYSKLYGKGEADLWANIVNKTEVQSPWRDPITYTPADSPKNAVEKAMLPNPAVVQDTVETASQIEERVVGNIMNASNEEAAELIADMPTSAQAVEQELLDDLVPNNKEIFKLDVPEDAPDGSSVNPSKVVHKKEYTLFELIHNAMAAVSKARNRDRATLRTDFVKKILDDTGSLTRHGVYEEDIAKYQRAQIYLSGAKVAKEEFLDTLASSGMIEMAFKNSAEAEDMLNVLNHNAAVVNVAAKGNVLKTFKHVLPNGNIATGIMFDTSNKNIVRMLEKGLKNINTNSLKDIVRLDPGSVSESVSKYIGSEKYRVIDEFFDRVRQAEGEYARVLGFKYDDTRHVKNVRNISPDVAEHYIKYLYKDININDLDAISEQFMASPAFKHLRGAWGSRKFDRRLLGYAEDFEDAEIGSLFSHNALQIVKGSLGEGSFNNSKFQLYVDLFQNDNFKINSFVSDVSQLEELFNARLADGTLSGNMQNLVLAAPRFDNTGRVIGFTQFDKTTRAGLEQALKNKDTVLLPAHVFAPLDKVLRRDAVMSNKVYAFINKHLTTPFKFGVLMNPGFLIGNANDAYLKQATTMAHKYGTSVPEELANVAASIRDVMVLNNEFDNAYRKVLTHIAAEGFTLAPTHHISELAASDPRIRKMLKDYVSNKLQKSKVSPIITCRLSEDEVLTIRTWLTLNSSSTTASFAAGLQDMDIIAKAKNSNAYTPNPNIVDRVLMGKGEYVSDDISTWGLMVNNPIARKFMDVSESTENLFRSAAILNDFRHKGLGTEYFKEYFNAKGSAEFKAKIMEDFDVNLSEAINTMHNANFDYERMTDFTDTVGKFVPFPTFFLKNLGYWLDVFVNHPQYIDHAITVQENLWNGKDTENDEFAAEAKGRGAVPLTADGQNMSNFFKGIFKPTPLQSMFGAFSLINNPVDDMYYRLHPLLSGGIAAASQLPPLQSIAADTLPQESIKYRPYSTDMYERNVSLGDDNFNPLSYTVHRLNPMERATQNLIRLPDKLEQDKAQLSDFLPSIFQPDF